VTPVHNLEEVILYEHVLYKKILSFHQIHLQLAETGPAKSGLKEEKLETEKMRLKYGLYSPNWWHL
jgi:hypothetical protein